MTLLRVPSNIRAAPPPRTIAIGRLLMSFLVFSARLLIQTLQNGTIDSEYMTIRTAIEPMPPY